MPRPGYSAHSIDTELRDKLIAIGEEKLAKQLGIVPTIPAVIRFLVKHYEMTSVQPVKKGKKQ